MTEFEKILQEKEPRKQRTTANSTERERSVEVQMKEKRDKCYAVVSDACAEIASDEEM